MASDIGIGAQFFIDGRDISHLLSDFRLTAVSGNVDTTRLGNRDRWRRHNVTLNGGTIGFTGDLPGETNPALESLARHIHGPRTPHEILLAPFGAEAGNLAIMGRSLRNMAELGNEIEGVESLNAEFEMTSASVASPGVLAGLIAFSPNGSDTPAPVNAKFAVSGTGVTGPLGINLTKAGGATELVNIPMPSTLAQIKTLVEATAGVGTANVTGAGLTFVEENLPDRVRVVGSGTPEVDGLYLRNGNTPAGYGAGQGTPFFTKVNYQIGDFYITGNSNGSWYLMRLVSGVATAFYASVTGGGANPPSEQWQGAGYAGANPAPNVTFSAAGVGPGTQGTADATVEITGPAATAFTVAKASGHANYSVQILEAGGTSVVGDLNLISTPTSGASLIDQTGLVADRFQSTTTGLLATLECPFVSPGGTSTWVIQHAPDNAGSPGTWTTLLTFDAVTTKSAQTIEVAPGVSTKPHLRARCTAVTGTVAVAIGVARRF